MSDRHLGRLQAWLQGCYPDNPYRPWVMWRLGNLLSDVRYWVWRARGGNHDAEVWDATIAFHEWQRSLSNQTHISIDPSMETTSTNLPRGDET